MNNAKEIVIIGEEEIGKTTLANALLGWDIFPQSNDEEYIATTAKQSRLLTQDRWITDTPGYNLFWSSIPADTAMAVSQADTVVVLLSEPLAEAYDPFTDDPDWDNAEEEEELPADDSDGETVEDVLAIPAVDFDWEEDREKEKVLLEKLLEGKTRDIYFVIPYDSAEWGDEQIPLEQTLCNARERFAYLTDHSAEGFFCIDPMKALIGAIEADDEAIAQSGLLSLKAALLGEGALL